ncbi:hypothetical protein, conserved [Plasmodium ovale curtisi]|uniref:Tubby C-terminal domain-containing protein n=1 Tax=Plasmodium ovale curtisi TaxID=864141 RepID=A0A1A8X0V4_PLAOA|nr:hypothetical protein, conserved [Plasmodium ovale curtisi]SBS97794.1 hypothetical protein, conserved [Plasmodium ovale curtisi]
MVYEKGEIDDRQKRLENIIKREFYFMGDKVYDLGGNITGGFIAKNKYSYNYCKCSKCEYVILVITEYIKKECVLDRYIVAYKKLYEDIDNYSSTISNISDIDYIIDKNFLPKNELINVKSKNVKNKIGEKYIEMETYTISVIIKIKTKIMNCFPMLKEAIHKITSHNNNDYYIGNRIGIIEKIKKKIYYYCLEKSRNRYKINAKGIKGTIMKYEQKNNSTPKCGNSFDEISHREDCYSYDFSFNNKRDHHVCGDPPPRCEMLKQKSYIYQENDYQKEDYYSNKGTLNIHNVANQMESNIGEICNVQQMDDISIKFYEIKITTNKNLISLKSILLLIEMVCMFYAHFIKCIMKNETQNIMNPKETDKYTEENIRCDEDKYLLFYNIILGKWKKKKKNENYPQKRKGEICSGKENHCKNFGEIKSVFYKKQSTSEDETDGSCVRSQSSNSQKGSPNSSERWPLYRETHARRDETNLRRYEVNPEDCEKDSCVYQDNTCDPHMYPCTVRKDQLSRYSDNRRSYSSCETFSSEKRKVLNSLSEKELEKINEYIHHVFVCILEECDTYFNIEFLFTLHTFELNFLFNLLKSLLLKKNLEDDLLVMLTYCAYKIQNKEIIDYCFWRLISIFESDSLPHSWVILDDSKTNNHLTKKYKEMKNNMREKKEKKQKKERNNVNENCCSNLFYETLNIIQGNDIEMNNTTEIDINNGNLYFKKNIIDKNIFADFVMKTKKQFHHYNDIPKGYVINEIQRLRNFNDYYSCCYILKNNKKQKILMGFKKRGENKVYIYKYDKNIKKKYKSVKTFFNISGFLGVLICNFTGMKIKIYDNGISEKFSNFFPSFERKNVLSIRFESNIISELPRHFICSIYKENKILKVIYENKCPMWNEEKEIYELPFYGRVKLASAKNLQLILKKCVISNSKKEFFSGKTINDVIEYVCSQYGQEKLENDKTYFTGEDNNNDINITTTRQNLLCTLRNEEANQNIEGGEEGLKNYVKKRFTFDIIKNNLKKKRDEKFEIVNKDEEEIFLIFGKNSKDYFTLDFRHPLSSFEAFSIAISSLLKKKAVS